nr:hypothetical protein [Tanacetum cinerariifolium]
MILISHTNWRIKLRVICQALARANNDAGFSIHVVLGDVILVGTDGLIDNLYKLWFMRRELVWSHTQANTFLRRNETNKKHEEWGGDQGYNENGSANQQDKGRDKQSTVWDCKRKDEEASNSCDKLVSWVSKKQDCNAMSLAEAKYAALSASCAQVIRWWRYPILAELDSLPHANAKTTKTNYEHQDARIKKAQELKTKTSANFDIKDNSSETKLQGRLLKSFQEDAKYEHVGQETRSQGGKDDQD